MKKKQNKEVVYINEFEPVIEVGGDRWGATYYSDLSGEVSIENNSGVIFCRDDGGLKWQLQYLQDHIKEIERAYKEDLKTCKEAIKVLNKEYTKYKTKKYVVKEEE
jgi:hypothetical protein